MGWKGGFKQFGRRLPTSLLIALSVASFQCLALWEEIAAPQPEVTTPSPSVPEPSPTSTVTPEQSKEAPTIPPGYSRERLHLKFQEGTAIRLRDNSLTTVGNDDLSGLEAVLRKYPGIRIERLFSRPEEELAQEKARIEAESGRQQADKNLYYRLILPPRTDAEALLSDLNALDIVEIAYAEPLPQPPPGNLPRP